MTRDAASAACTTPLTRPRALTLEARSQWETCKKLAIYPLASNQSVIMIIDLPFCSSSFVIFHVITIEQEIKLGRRTKLTQKLFINFARKILL